MKTKILEILNKRNGKDERGFYYILGDETPLNELAEELNALFDLREVSGSIGTGTNDTLMEMTIDEIEKDEGQCSLCKYGQRLFIRSVCRKCISENTLHQYYR
jgi:hypothetical protein